MDHSTPLTTAICTKCHIAKPLTDFWRHARKNNDRDSWCKECVRAKGRELREEDREGYRAKKRKNYAENIESYRERSRRSASRLWYANKQAQGDGFLLINREKVMRERLRRFGLHTEKVDYARILERDGYFCHICQKAIEPKQIDKIEFDHVMPYQKGGDHTEGNIAVAHIRCNRRKQNKLLDELDLVA